MTSVLIGSTRKVLGSRPLAVARSLVTRALPAAPRSTNSSNLATAACPNPALGSRRAYSSSSNGGGKGSSDSATYTFGYLATGVVTMALFMYGFPEAEHKKPYWLESTPRPAVAESTTEVSDASSATEAGASPAVDVESEHPSASETASENVVKTDSVAAEPLLLEAKYVLVGGGVAAFAAMAAIQEREPKADILLITEEEHTPYLRTPLSKELWFESDHSKVEKLEFRDWNGKPRQLFLREESDFSTDVSKPGKKPRILKGKKATSLNVDSRFLVLEDGTKIKYSKLLLATGGRPKIPDFMKSIDPSIKNKVTTFRGLNDFRYLDNLTENTLTPLKIAVIGGGFLGSELSFALSQRGDLNDIKVTQIFKEAGNLGLVVPRYLSEWTTKKIRETGVEVIPKTDVEQLAADKDGRVVLKLSEGREVVADHVVVAAGIVPNIELAEKAGLEIDHKLGGVVVNAELEARTGVFVAGDVSSFHDIALGRRRVEHHDHAMLSGKTAGENMTGMRKPYTHQSMFWSDLGPEIGFEAVGIIDSSLKTVGVWAKGEEQGSKNDPGASEKKNKDIKEDFDRGVVFYLRDRRVVGILTWNIFNRVHTARKIIREAKQVDDISELANLLRVHNN